MTAYLIDMDGVLVRGEEAIPGAGQFIARLRAAGTRFMVFTNNSRFTPRVHAERLRDLGLEVTANEVFTSALATAYFLANQRPGGSAFVVGEEGLISALADVGVTRSESDPDYVVLGETTTYDFAAITTAMRLVSAGARFVATNPDVSGPSELGIVPACGAIAALISAASHVRPYFVGKPNPLMMRAALRRLGAHSEETTMIGDRMDTDVVAGMESGLETILVLSGVTREADIATFPYRPSRVAPSVDALAR